jgi:hypothetical protein
MVMDLNSGLVEIILLKEVLLMKIAKGALVKTRYGECLFAQCCL